MFRQHSRVAGAYRVTFSPEAWKEIGRLSSTTFMALQEALDQLAQQGRPGSSSEPNTAISFMVDCLRVHCERDEQSRTLILQRVTPAAPGITQSEP